MEDIEKLEILRGDLRRAKVKMSGLVWYFNRKKFYWNFLPKRIVQKINERMISKDLEYVEKCRRIDLGLPNKLLPMEVCNK